MLTRTSRSVPCDSGRRSVLAEGERGRRRTQGSSTTRNNIERRASAGCGLRCSGRRPCPKRPSGTNAPFASGECIPSSFEVRSLSPSCQPEGRGSRRRQSVRVAIRPTAIRSRVLLGILSTSVHRCYPMRVRSPIGFHARRGGGTSPHVRGATHRLVSVGGSTSRGQGSRGGAPAGWSKEQARSHEDDW